MKMKKWLAVLMTLAVTTAGLAGGGGNRIRGNGQQ